MSRRKITRQVEKIVETHGPRRSPRLSSRYMRSREVGEPGLTPFPLASVTYTATSRQSLGSYKVLEEQTVGNILDESGQSVPPYFEEDESFVASAAVQTEGTTDILQHEYISAATAQHYGTPPERMEGECQHLYGLDDDESTHSDVEESELRMYHHYNKERVLTPPKDTRPFASSGHGFCWKIVSFFLGVLYKLGSLLYLAATAILCLDVMILHRLFTTFHSMAGGMEGRPTLSWHRFWILPVTLCALVVCLIGGGLVPESTIETSPPGTIPMNYSDFIKLRAQILQGVNASMQKEMSTFFRFEVESYIEKRIEKAILASEVNLETSLKDQFTSEVDQRQAALKQLKQSMWKELNSTLEAHQLSLQSSFEFQLSSLRQFVLEQVESGLTESMVIAIARKQLDSAVKEQLNATKKEWIAEADKKFMADIRMSTTSLKEELLQLFNIKYEEYSNQLLDFNSKFDQSSLKNQVQELKTKLQATSSDVSAMKHSANRLEETLQHKLSETAAELNQSFLEILEEKEDKAAIKHIVLSIFNEELDKLIKERLQKSEMWNKDVPDNGLSRKDVEQLISVALAKYSADRIAKFDFALEDAGGSVVTSKCSKTYTPTLATVSLFGIPLWHVTTSPKAIIQPQVYPGDCWAFEGSKGHALIRLKEEIVITGVTLEHIPRELTPNGSLATAPKTFSVWGKNNCEDEESEEKALLGTFTYTENGPPVQEFTVTVLDQAQPKTYSYVLFEFLSNYGSEHYTCVYRVRVHGHYLQ